MTRSFRVGGFTLKDWEPGEEERIVASFNRVFAAVDPSFRPRTLEFWRWQYLENPSGKLLIWARAPDGAVAAHHAFIVQRILLRGEPALCGQMVDSMVDPRYRRGLQRTTLSALLSNTFIRHTGGAGPGRHAFYWGAPVPVALRIGKALVQYEVVRTQLKLRAPVEGLHPRPAPGVEVEEIESVPEGVAGLFREAARPYGAIALRDAAQLEWRLVKRPQGRYRLALAKRGGRISGLAVVARGAFDGAEDEGLVADWLVPPDDPPSGHALRAWLVERCRDAGLEHLTALFPDTAPDWIAFQRAGLRAAPTQYPIVARSCVRGVTPWWLRGAWYYTLGDTDLV